jgi:signal transduction histidine kinase
MSTINPLDLGSVGSISGDLASLEERLLRRERELDAIRRMTAAVCHRTDLDEIEREALHVGVETLHGSGGTIYLHNPERKTLVFRYVLGATPEITKKLLGMEMPDDQGMAGEVFQTGKGRITLDVSKANHHSRVDERINYVTKSGVTVPLLSMGGKKVGVMQVLNKRVGHFDESDLEVLEILAAQAGSAIENAMLFEDARRASVVNLIGDISHDVKNFLTPVVTGGQTLEMMLDAMFERLDQAGARMNAADQEAVYRAIAGVREFYGEGLSMVYDGAEAAQDRVREIADAIKGIIAQPHFELSDFRERAEAVAKVLKLVAARRRVAIDLSGIARTEPIELDRKGIYNALYNLINNAIPETPEGGRIAVRTRAIEVLGKPYLEIQVQDNGRGIPRHVLDRMFTDHAVSTKPGGTGLGTRIVKNVVDIHHGMIRVQSELGKGTLFTIQIPMRQPVEG